MSQAPDACPTQMTFISLKDTDPEAVCMDGSHAGFWYHKGEDPSLFTMYLMGGDDCEDEESCVARMQNSPNMAGTAHLQEGTKQEFGGLFDSCYSALGKGTIAYSQYCTSDLYMGDQSDAGFTGDGKGMKFMGQRYVVAMLKYMIAHKELGQHMGQKLIS